MSLLEDERVYEGEVDQPPEDLLTPFALELPKLYDKFENPAVISRMALIGAAVSEPRVLAAQYDPREVEGKPITQVHVGVLREALAAGPGDPLYDTIRQAFPQDTSYRAFISRFREYIPAYVKLFDPSSSSGLEGEAKKRFNETHQGLAAASNDYFSELTAQYPDSRIATAAMKEIFATQVGPEISYHFLSGSRWLENRILAEERLSRDDPSRYQSLGFLAIMERISRDFHEQSLGHLALADVE